MAGEKAKIIRKPRRVIRARARVDHAAGDFAHVRNGHPGGFFINETKRNDYGDYCIDCDEVEIDNPFTSDQNHIVSLTVSSAGGNRDSLLAISGTTADRTLPGVIGCTKGPVKASDTRIRISVFQG